jgi:ABC-2 type transport system ATP-binding protein
MRDLVRRLAGEGLTILLSSHLLYEVEELCNRVAIIRKGRIIFQGGLRDLMAQAVTGYRLTSSQIDHAYTVCVNHPGVEQVLRDGTSITFVAEEETVGGLSIALGQARVPVTSLAPHGDTLEDLFLRLTGGESSDHDRRAVAS